MTTREKVLHYVRSQPHSPTVQEIAQKLGKSKSTIHVHLIGLERAGLIERIGEQRRIYPAQRHT